jgi:hypothetical protein
MDTEQRRAREKRRRPNACRGDDFVATEEDEAYSNYGLVMEDEDEECEDGIDEETADDILHSEEVDFGNRATAAERRRWKDYGELASLLNIQELVVLQTPRLTKHEREKWTGKPLTACILQYMAFVKTTTLIAKAMVEIRRVLGRVPVGPG